MQRTQTICLVILTTIAIGFSLYYLKTVLLPFVISLFVVIGCQPIVEVFEQRFRLNRYLSYFAAFFVGTLLMLIFLITTWLSVKDLANHSAAYESRLNFIAERILNQIEEENAQPSTSLESSDEGQANSVVKAEDARDAVSQILQSATQFLTNQLPKLAGSLSTLLSYGVLILIFVFFLLLGQNESQFQQPRIIREIELQIRQYLVVKTVISAATGFAFGFVLWLFGIPLAILFGFLAFLLNFIPNIGPLISMLTPIPFLILNSEISPTAAVICFILVALIQFISGNVIETKIMGNSFDVSPVVLLIALMFFGLVWGIIGMFLATPIVSIIKIILQQNEPTHAIGEVMAGRWKMEDPISS